MDELTLANFRKYCLETFGPRDLNPEHWKIVENRALYNDERHLLNHQFEPLRFLENLPTGIQKRSVIHRNLHKFLITKQASGKLPFSLLKCDANAAKIALSDPKLLSAYFSDKNERIEVLRCYFSHGAANLVQMQESNLELVNKCLFQAGGKRFVPRDMILNGIVYEKGAALPSHVAQYQEKLASKRPVSCNNPYAIRLELGEIFNKHFVENTKTVDESDTLEFLAYSYSSQSMLKFMFERGRGDMTENTFNFLVSSRMFDSVFSMYRGYNRKLKLHYPLLLNIDDELYKYTPLADIYVLEHDIATFRTLVMGGNTHGPMRDKMSDEIVELALIAKQTWLVKSFVRHGANDHVVCFFRLVNGAIDSYYGYWENDAFHFNLVKRWTFLENGEFLKDDAIEFFKRLFNLLDEPFDPPIEKTRVVESELTLTFQAMDLILNNDLYQENIDIGKFKTRIESQSSPFEEESDSEEGYDDELDESDYEEWNEPIKHYLIPHHIK